LTKRPLAGAGADGVDDSAGTGACDDSALAPLVLVPQPEAKAKANFRHLQPHYHTPCLSVCLCLSISARTRGRAIATASQTTPPLPPPVYSHCPLPIAHCRIGVCSLLCILHHAARPDRTSVNDPTAAGCFHAAMAFWPACICCNASPCLVWSKTWCGPLVVAVHPASSSVSLLLCRQTSPHTLSLHNNM
jgi:hypothetical protein